MFQITIPTHAPPLIVSATRRLTAMWLFLSICLMSAHAMASEKIDYADCLGCHQGIERISTNHPFSCAACHLRPGEGEVKTLTDHRKIVRNPSAPEHLETFCVRCHQREVMQIRNSLHSSMAGVINQTRYLWGAQETASPGIYGLSGPLKPLPGPQSSVYPETPAMLVDDFLRRRCLRCHIQTRGPEGAGLYRGNGCAACHVLYNTEGRYEGGDPAIDRSKKGYPVRHMFTAQIPNSQCLHCHNHNHVGADYEGLFELDYSDTYRSPMVNGQLRPMIYGLDHHHLTRDIHAEKALWCIDCHTRKDVMGDGYLYSYQMEVPKRSCSDCHGGFDGKPPDMTNKAIRKDSDGYLFTSRNHGRRHRLSLFRRDSTAHRIEAHADVRCSACHAQWSYQDYGLSVMREDRINDYKWRHLSIQADPYLEEKLKGYAESPETAYPVSVDRLSGQEKEGIWSAGWRFRRWEPMPLGVDPAGRVAILRPLYQYLISYVDRLGNVPLDSVAPSRGDGTGRGWAFMPYVPHTTAPFGRACTACHQNRVAAGLGIQDEITVDTALTIPSPPAIKTMRLLNPQEQERLLQPTTKWHKERLRSLKTDYE
ncbi:MAG: hypothetical protein JRL30_03035 [Deltaproteobacteria bacterium]|nr:hypothetical protein [Deltaproteobacteria bacterium]